jgi:antibiotic biosynthesis monooxygenase (ABM) superfamily enzyme
MIARMWRGWVASEANADLYEEFLRSSFFPAARAIPGFKGASVLRRSVGHEVEFTTITRFESVDAIKQFAGDDYEAAHIAPQARKWLSRFDERCVHSELVIETSPPEASA